MRTRVKICGITRIEDAIAAVDAGADALGMVFYEPSPRHIDVNTAVEIAKQIPAFVTLVGLFVDANQAQVQPVLDSVPLQLIQFHGNEDPEFCGSFNLPYIKALRVGRQGGLSGEALQSALRSYKDARGLLLDTYQKGIPGGTGESFDWGLIPEAVQNLILAGGLSPDNVAEAIQAVRPYAVDVSGGVESAPGIKDKAKINAFISNTRQAD